MNKTVCNPVLPTNIYIKQGIYKGKEVYWYSFLKNAGLFKWMLTLPMFQFDKEQKRICSESKQEILDYLEISGKGKIRTNKFHILEAHLQRDVKGTAPTGILTKNIEKIKSPLDDLNI